MNENQREPGKLARFFEEKGFYIILFLCVAAIGIAGYVLFLDPMDTLDTPPAADIAAETATAPDLSASLVRPGRETRPPEALVTIPDAPPVVEERAEPAAETAAPAEEPAADRDSVIREAAATLAQNRAEEETEADIPASAPVDAPPTFFVRPVTGELVRDFSGDELVYDRTMGDWRTHNGVDLMASEGDLVSAIADGVVEDVYRDDYYGTGILLDHGGGLKSVYLGLIENATVQPGQRVAAGDTLGAVSGSTLFESLEPVHLHLEMTLNGQRVNPLDYLPA